MRGMATPAALVMTSGTLASAVSGAIAAAIGEPTTPSRIWTWSRVISSWATRLPTSGLAAVVALDDLDLDAGRQILLVLLDVEIDALLHLVAGLARKPGSC